MGCHLMALLIKLLTHLVLKILNLGCDCDVLKCKRSLLHTHCKHGVSLKGTFNQIVYTVLKSYTVMHSRCTAKLTCCQQPCLLVDMLPSSHGVKIPIYPVAQLPCCHAAMLPCCHAAMLPAVMLGKISSFTQSPTFLI